MGCFFIISSKLGKSCGTELVIFSICNSFTKVQSSHGESEQILDSCEHESSGTCVFQILQFLCCLNSFHIFCLQGFPVDVVQLIFHLFPFFHGYATVWHKPGSFYFLVRGKHPRIKIRLSLSRSDYPTSVSFLMEPPAIHQSVQPWRRIGDRYREQITAAGPQPLFANSWPFNYKNKISSKYNNSAPQCPPYTWRW